MTKWSRGRYPALPSPPKPTRSGATPYAARVIRHRKWFSSAHGGWFATTSPMLHMVLLLATGAGAAALDSFVWKSIRRAEGHSLECRRNECAFLLNAPEPEFLACVTPCIDARETRWKRLNNE